MRGVYLRKSDESRNGGCRGGVGSGNEYGDYALEIGNGKNADCEMLALCSMIDEIREYFELCHSPLAYMILREWKETTKKLQETSQT